MPKTENLGIEITTDNTTLFEQWRNFINGDSPDSFANIVDAAIGNIEEVLDLVLGV